MSGSRWKGLPHGVLADAGVTVSCGLVRVPYRDRDGTELNAKFFPLRPDSSAARSWWEQSGRALTLFGPETLPSPRVAPWVPLLLCEGESDALAVRHAVAGNAAVLAVPGAGTWRREWRRPLEPFPVIYVLGDGDRAGRAMNAEVKRDVPWARPVWLPDGEDARSVVQRDGVDALELFLAEADRDARLAAAFVLARDLDECEALLGRSE